MTRVELIFILSTISVYLFNYKIFEYMATKSENKKMLMVKINSIAIINVLVVHFAEFFLESYITFYFVIIVIMAIEILIVSKKPIHIVIYEISTSISNLIAANMISVTLISMYFSVTPLELLRNESLYFIMMFATHILGTIIFLRYQITFYQKIINDNKVQAYVMSGINIVLIIFMIVDSLMMVSEEFYMDLNVTLISSYTYYALLLYVIIAHSFKIFSKRTDITK